MGHQDGLQFLAARVARLERKDVGVRQEEAPGIDLSLFEKSIPHMGIKFDQSPKIIPGMGVEEFALCGLVARARHVVVNQRIEPD